jgi:outer membrane protein insertion porin family
VPYKGSTTTAGYQIFGPLGGEVFFQKVSLGWDYFHMINEDLLERRTVLGFHLDTGYIFEEAPFFDRFYAGGLGSVRGFQFRGISPRDGPEDDAIGGDFLVTASLELGFPLVGDNLRGVVFTDAGTVERDLEVHRIRTSIGAGIRLVLPILGQAPLALDFAVPITKDDQDETQLISFSFGIIQ